MLSLLDRLQVGQSLLRLINDPNRTEEIFKIAEKGLKNEGHPSMRYVSGHALSHDGFRELFERQYLAPKVDLLELEKLPEGTLGREYARHMLGNGLSPEFFPRFQTLTPLRYLSIRARESHDIWHVLTGFGVGVWGELALQGFTAAQLRSTMPVTIISAGLLHVVRFDPTKVAETLGGVAAGFNMGMKTRFLLGFPLESYWERSLTDLRAMLGIEGVGQLRGECGKAWLMKMGGHESRRPSLN